MNGIADGVRQVRESSVNQVDDVEHVLVTSGTGGPTGGPLARVDPMTGARGLSRRMSCSCRAPLVGNPTEKLRQHLHVDIECSIGPDRSAVPGSQWELVLNGNGSDQSVVHGPTGNVELRKATQQVLGKRRTEKTRRRKVSGEDLSDGARGSAKWRWQATENGERLECGVAGEPDTSATHGVDGRLVILVIEEDQSHGDAGVNQHVRGRHRWSESRSALTM